VKPYYHILLLEDDMLDKETIFRTFEELSEFRLSWVSNLAQARTFLAGTMPDLIISDSRLADGTGLELSAELNCRRPFILMIGLADEQLAFKSMKAGVSDYLVKSPDVLLDLPNCIRRVLWEWDNITARLQVEQELKESEERYRLVAESSDDVIWDYVVATGKILFFGQWPEMMKIQNGRTICTVAELRALIHRDDRKVFDDEVKKYYDGVTALLQVEYRIILPGQNFKWVRVRGKGLRDAKGKIIRLAGSLTDITERKRYELKVSELAYYDAVTGLPNRTLLNQALGRFLAENAQGAVFDIDIDNFKKINDAFGHSFGDKVIYKLARMLKKIDISDKFICRFSEDEFVVVVEELYEPEAVKKAAELMLNCFNAPLEIEKSRFYLTASIGVTVYPADGKTLEEILKNVDAALFTAKTKGKNTITYFDKSIRQSMHNKVEMEAYLRTAIDNAEFCLHYQPLVEAASNRIYGFEALIRWNSPKFGLTAPLDFIKLAEETGLIIPIGYWVLRTACAFAATLHPKYPDIQVWVNISSIQLIQTDFVEWVKTIIETTGIPPYIIGIEITESVLMESFEGSVQKLVELKNYGLGIALDDFGTGYSSLNYLKKLPISLVKIDKFFIDDISGSNLENEITSQIVQLAHKMGLKVVGEGVETAEQMAFLKEYQCNFVQGYLISKPIPEDRVEELLHRFG
jgi:diguanylate cyclase (GGDEF)-like protein/PAS domain S-box-containing protein